MTGKTYHKFQISRKCLDKIFASILRFILFLRARTEESDTQNDIKWFLWTEIDKFGTVKSGLTGEGSPQVLDFKKMFWQDFCIDS